MRKLFLFIALGLFVGTARASVATPKDDRGNSLYSSDLVGAIPCTIGNSTGTSFVICNSTSLGGSVAPLSRGVVYGVIASSVALSDFLVFRDTTGATSPNSGIPSTNANVINGSTVAIVYNTLPGVQSATLGTVAVPFSNYIKFPAPIQFLNGIAVNAGVSPANAGISFWTILWRPLKATE